MPRPSGAAPGFLTAIQQAIRLSEAGAGDDGAKTRRTVPYVYNDSVYDLTTQGREGSVAQPSERGHSSS